MTGSRMTGTGMTNTGMTDTGMTDMGMTGMGMAGMGGAVVIYGLKNCDSCRRAMKALGEATLSDVRADGVPDAVLDRALARFGEKLLNTRSTTWRGLDAAARAAPPRELLQRYPTLMKRPLIEAGGALYLGWGSDVRAALLDGDT